MRIIPLSACPFGERGGFRGDFPAKFGVCLMQPPISLKKCKDMPFGLSYYVMKRKIIPYNPNLVPLARKLRNNSTLSEVLLWQKIKGKKMGYDFDRQKPILNYIVDFYCRDLLLAIEIDGNSHDHKAKEDLRRQERIESFGVTFIRFDDLEVKKNMDEVLQTLEWGIQQLAAKG
jgi:very-short-patch-repair endonuclease